MVFCFKHFWKQLLKCILGKFYCWRNGPESCYCLSKIDRLDKIKTKNYQVHKTEFCLEYASGSFNPDRRYQLYKGKSNCAQKSVSRPWKLFCGIVNLIEWLALRHFIYNHFPVCNNTLRSFTFIIVGKSALFESTTVSVCLS